MGDMSSEEQSEVSRRLFIQVLSAMGVTAPLPLGIGCAAGGGFDPEDVEDEGWGPSKADGQESRTTRTIKALMNVMIPAEYDAYGAMVSVGAVEAGAYDQLQTVHLIHLAETLGFIPDLPEWIVSSMSVLDFVYRRALRGDLDSRAGWGRSFLDLTDEEKVAVVDEGFRENEAMYELVRAGCMVAYLGAPYTDAGLVEIGMPPYEDFDDDLAVSGYPRGGDDYTYNRVPPVGGDDISNLIDAYGDPV